jgi:hypothetical protein
VKAQNCQTRKQRITPSQEASQAFIDGYFRQAVKFFRYNGERTDPLSMHEPGNIMRDLDALLGSLINIDRNSLIAILSSEFEAAKGIAKSTGQRTTAQRSKRRAARRAGRSDRPYLVVPATWRNRSGYVRE